jgi:hypothetical protein
MEIKTKTIETVTLEINGKEYDLIPKEKYNGEWDVMFLNRTEDLGDNIVRLLQVPQGWYLFSYNENTGNVSNNRWDSKLYAEHYYVNAAKAVLSEDEIVGFFDRGDDCYGAW